MSAITPPLTLLPFLAPEIKIRICKYLSSVSSQVPKDILSLRLVSKDWSNAATTQLYKNGTIVLTTYRTDTDRLKHLARCKWFVARIKHIEIWTGDLDFSVWAQMIRERERDEENRDKW